MGSGDREAQSVAVRARAGGRGTDEATEDATSSPVETISDVDDIDVAVDSMVGLEVSAVGNVSDVLSAEAMRIDRDGLGNVEDRGEVGSALESDYDYDYDYYDYDDLTEYDADFGDDDVTDDGVLVVDAAGLQSFDVDQPVRVSGTVRRFDQDIIESLYEVNLEDDVFDSYEDSLVIVADSVQAASSAATRGDSTTPGASASPSDANTQ